MDTKRLKELQDLQVELFGELTMMGKKIVGEIAALSTMLKLDEQRVENLPEVDREEYFERIAELANEYHTIVEKNIAEMQKIVDEMYNNKDGIFYRRNE